MKFECLKDDFKKAVFFTNGITSKNTTLPILTSILISTKKQSIIIRATNLEIGIEVSVPAKVEKEGEIAVSGVLIQNILSNIYSGEKVLVSEDKGNLTIKTQNNKLTIKSYPPDDFPTIPTISNGSEFSIQANYILTGIKSVAYSATLSDVKPEISSVYIYSEEKNIIFVSTDSIRLAEKKIQLPSYVEFSPIILPLKTAIELEKILEEHKEENLTVIYNTNQIAFIVGDVYLTSRIINGSFPDYKQILPKNSTTEVIILKQDLLNALKISNIFSDKFHKVVFTINPQKKEFIITSQNMDIGENNTHLDATLKGEAISLAFNQRYITENLQFIEKDSIVLHFNGAHKPIIIKTIGDQTYTYLLAPMTQ